MKPLFANEPMVSYRQNRKVARIIHCYLWRHGVDRASSLPEEAKVWLYRDLQWFYDDPEGYIEAHLSYWERFIRRIRSSFRTIHNLAVDRNGSGV